MEIKEKKNTTGKALGFSVLVWVGYVMIVLAVLLIFFRI